MLLKYTQENGITIRNKNKGLTQNTDTDYIKNMVTQFNESKLSADAFNESVDNLDDSLLSYFKTVKNGEATVTGYNTYVKETNNSIGIMGVKAKATSIMVGVLNAALYTAIGLFANFMIGKFLDNFIYKEEKIAEAAENAKNNIEELKSSFDTLKSSTNDIKERYAELAQGIDQLNGKNLTLSDDEYKEFLDLSNQLAELFPTLTKNYDDNGNAILNLSGDVNTIVSNLNDLVEVEQKIANQKILDNLPDVYADLNNKISKSNNKILNYKQLMESLPKDFSINGLGNMSFSLDTDKHTLNSKYQTYIRKKLNKEFKEYGLDDASASVDLNYASGEYDLNISGLEDTKEYYNKLKQIFADVRLDITKEIQETNSSIKSEMSGFNQYIYSWLSTDWNYVQLDEGFQTAIQQILFNTNWIDDIPDNVDSSNWNQVSKWLEENYLSAFDDIDDQEIIDKITELFTKDLTPQTKLNFAQELQAYFNDNDIKIKLDFITDVDKEGATANLIERVKNKNNELTSSVESLEQAYVDVRQSREKAYSNNNYVGNVDINNRPIVINDDGSYSTTSTGFQEYWKGNEKDGGYEIIHFTPILPDGTVLDDKTLYNYLDNVLAKADNALEADKPENGGLGIVYKVDTEVNGEKITDKNLDTAFDQADQWDAQMHETQAKMYNDEAYALIEYNQALKERDELTKFFEDYSIDTDEEYNEWLTLTEGINNTIDAINAWKESHKEDISSNFLDSEDNIGAIDDYKEKISDLSSYLKIINSEHELSASDMATLYTTYGITADSVEEYKEKIIDLMNDTASNSEIMTALANAIANCNDEAMKSQLQSLYDNLQNINKEAQDSANSFGNLDTAISTLQNKAQLLRDIKDIGYIDSSSLDDIISTYPELTDKIAEYNAGLITSQQLINSLTEAYETDVKNYAIAVGEKLKYDTNYYENVKQNIPQWLSNLAKSYGIDFNNYKNLCEAKLSLDKQYAQKKLILNQANAELDEAYDKVENSSGTTRVDAEYEAQKAKQKQMIAKKNLEGVQSIIDGVDDTLSATLDLNMDWNSFGKDPNKDKNKGNKDSKQEIDWLEQSLTVLQTKVDELQTTFDNTTGIDNQIAALNNLNSALKDLKNGYKTAYDTYKSRYNKAIKSLGKNGSSIKKKIESGKSFDLKEYDSKTAEKIQNAIDAYNEMTKAQEKVNSLAKEIYDNKTIEKSKLYQADYENQLDVINEKLENQTLTAGEKNKLLDDQLKLQIAINKELRKQAEYSGDYETIDKLNAEDKNNKLQHKLDNIQNNQDENQKLIDRYNKQLEDTTLTTSEIDDINKALQKATNDDFRYQMETEIAKIDSTAWKNYITNLKKKYKETKLSDEEFIKKHIEEISNYFDNTDMSKIYQEYLNSQIDNKSTNYETYKTARGYRIQTNENDIADINNVIEAKGGRGTQEQYEQLRKLYQSNLGYWEEQKKEAEKMLLTAKEGTAEWDKWNNELQECEDNVSDCNEKIKDCYSSILKLPLNDVEDSLDKINKQISDIDDQISEKDTLISAANYLIDQQIEGYDLLKESIQDQIDALQEEKSLREANLNVQKAEYNLEKIRNQKNVKTFREGVGWTYEANMDDIKSAQEEYDNAVYDRKITLLEHQIDLYDDEIEKLNDIKNQWNSIVDDIQNIMDFNEALLYDSDFAQKVLTNDYSLIAAISGEYRNLLETKSVYEDQQNDYEKLQDEINEVVELYEREGITYEEAKKRIHSAIQIYYPEILSKYENESETLDRIIEQKLDDSEVSTSTNEAMLESYQYFLGEMNDIFDELNDMLKRFETNTYDMIYSVNRSISNLQDNIQSAINAANALNSISSSSSKSKTNIIMGLTSIGKSHSGMELGTVRKNMDNGSGSNSDFKALCLSELEPNEILRVLKVGENVLTPNQTNNIMSNFKNLASVKVPTLPLRNQEVNKSVEFNGDIVVQGVQDTGSFARSLKQNLPNAFMQELYK